MTNLYTNLNNMRQGWANEEELRIGWLKALSSSLGIELQAERKKLDSSYNNVIIEFKAPKLFHGRTNSPAFKEAIHERLKPYIMRKSTEDGLEPEAYIGIAIDGDHICFARIVENDIVHGELLAFSEASVQMVATALTDSFRRAITVSNLVEDFGLSSDSGIKLMQAMANALSTSIGQQANNKIKMLFAEWQTLFGQVADLSVSQLDGIRRSIRFTFSNNMPQELIIPASLFVIHTYNSLIIKLLAAEIVSAHNLTSRRVFAESIVTLPDNRMFAEISEQIEKGKLFEAAGIKGFVEEAIFGWYLDACSYTTEQQNILSGIRDTLIKLSFYRTESLADARTQDILKGFYQSLVPEDLRKSLGEFYTPDWLVEFTLNKLQAPRWLTDRFLDPTCGSGSFLLAVVKRLRLQAQQAGLSPRETLDIISDHVWGFDLNPLAVQTSRVNMLMAVADLLKACGGKQIEFPVLLADAVYSPAPNPTDPNEIVTYSIGSQVANLQVKIPSALVLDRDRLDKIFVIMGEQVEQNQPFETAFDRIYRALIITDEEKNQWEEPLRDTYDRILELHKKNWNGIWFRIVRNFFWSATAGAFDAIVGNPPWVRWSKLPALYRERVKPTCEQYDIFSSTPHHGGNELDISGMITYTVADKWLKHGGELSFVITQTHFQSPSSEGFRSFSINGEDRLNPVSIDDMKALKPFPDAANKTAVALFRKEHGVHPAFPVPYTVWTSKQGYTRTIPANLPLQQVLNRIDDTQMEANPVTSERSPWAVLPPKRFQTLRRIAGESKWVNGRKGITADLNGVYFVNVVDVNSVDGLVQIETRPDAGRTDIGPKQRFWIEPSMLYPLIKGAADFSAFRVAPRENLFAIVPNKGVSNDACDMAQHLLDTTNQRTKNYLSNFEPLLKNRSTLKRYMRGKPYYSIYNVGPYTFAPYKVVWAEQSSTFASAVVTSANVPLLGQKVFVPDHKVFFVDFSDPAPAYYLCGLLNSNDVREFIESHNISIQTGDIFKHMNLPAFDSQNAKHLELSRLVELAHNDGLDDQLRQSIMDCADILL